MSFSAFVHTGQHFILYSDGAAYDSASHEITSLKTRKVWKINERTALCWMGTRPELINHFVENVKGYNAASAISILSDRLERGVNPLDFHSVKRAMILYTFEFIEGSLHWNRSSYSQGKMEPEYRGTIRPGSSGEIVEGGNLGIFTKNLKYYDPGDAFKRALQTYKRQGRPVGGQIFTVTIPCHPPSGRVNQY